MKTYTEKSTQIEAVQWNGDNTDEIIEWGQGKIEFSYGRPATIHSLSCQCDGRGMVPSDRTQSSVVTCPETRPTGAVPSGLLILTPIGKMTAEVNDWVIKDEEGFFACKEKVFEETYEPVKKLTPQEVDYADLAERLDSYCSGTVHRDGSVDSIWPKYFNSPGTAIVTLPAPVVADIRLVADIIAASASSESR